MILRSIKLGVHRVVGPLTNNTRFVEAPSAKSQQSLLIGTRCRRQCHQRYGLGINLSHVDALYEQTLPNMSPLLRAAVLGSSEGQQWRWRDNSSST